MQRPQSTVTIQSQQVNYTSHGPSGSFSYAIKLIPKKKADFSIQKLRGIAGMYKSIEDLKEDILSACNGEISIDSFGYIEPGHGNRGKQQWLSSNDDLKDMYTVHQGKPDILLWAQRCDATRKRAHTPDEETAKRTRYDKYLDKMTEVEMIEEELKGKHTDDQYTDEQIRSWAHLIQMKKHSSYDCPPNKRFWKVAQPKRPSTGSSSLSTCTFDTVTPDAVNVSPGKRVNLRGQCVQQLLQLHELLEKGGINKQQYDEMQSTIMGDVKKY